MITIAVRFAMVSLALGQGRGNELDPVRRLAEEVRAHGWVVYSSRSDRGDWDLFACRPDGSDVRNLTSTPEYHEAAPQVSRDGARLLFRRLAAKETIDGNLYGTQGALIVARSDGTDPQALGEAGEYPWASWSPNGRQIACLSIRGISLIDLADRRVVKTIPRRGFFQQLTWSPDGERLLGVSNAFGASWGVARMEIASGVASGLSGADCCTPDWIADGHAIVYSNRPAGQEGNGGNGWTQLWTADADGRNARLVYGEDGRHVYGGCASRDGRFVLFTGNMKEDGDPSDSGAPMGLMRLADAPIIGGESHALRRLHPQAKSGPVLLLPRGWEPCWTPHEIFPSAQPSKTGEAALAANVARNANAKPDADTKSNADTDVAALAAEVRTRGWIAFSAQSDQGDWDLMLARPDGSARRALTQTPESHEAGVRFSPDGKRLLYYRIPRAEPLDNNTYGTFELIVADADGGQPVSWGRGFPWASWGPDGTQLACLDPRGVHLYDAASRREIRKWPRRGLVQQLAWSPDGKWFTGTANGLGPFWNIGRMDAASGALNAVSETERYNCTPDWMPDSQGILYSRGIVPETGGCAELWLGRGDGSEHRRLYAEPKRHIYGGCASPDGKYLLFTRSEADLGPVDRSRTSLSLIRTADTPMVIGPPEASDPPRGATRQGPRLDLSWGWEPHWTYAEIAADPPPAPAQAARAALLKGE